MPSLTARPIDDPLPRPASVAAAAGERPAICMISPMWPSPGLPYFGVFVKVIAEGLRGAGWTVDTSATVQSPSHGPAQKLLRHARLAARIVRLWARPPKFIYLHSPAWFSALIFPLLRRDTLLVINIHGSEIHGRRRIAEIAWRVTGRLLQRADLVISPSETFAGVIAAEAGVVRNRIVVSPSGGFQGATFFHDPAIARPVPLVGYVSRITRRKGWRLFLDTVAALRADVPDVRGVLIGGGEEVDALKAEIAARGLGDCVEYLGPMPQAALREQYARMDAFLFTSDIGGVDTLGLVALEAMACGTPVVATRAGITREYVEEGVNGFTCARGDVAAFAAAARACLGWDEERRAAIAQGAARFETGPVAAELSAVLAGALAAKRAARAVAR